MRWIIQYVLFKSGFIQTALLRCFLSQFWQFIFLSKSIRLYFQIYCHKICISHLYLTIFWLFMVLFLFLLFVLCICVYSYFLLISLNRDLSVSSFHVIFLEFFFSVYHLSLFIDLSYIFCYPIFLRFILFLDSWFECLILILIIKAFNRLNVLQSTALAVSPRFCYLISALYILTF